MYKSTLNRFIFLCLGDGGTMGPPGPPGPSSASPMNLNAASLMSLFTTATQMAQLSNIEPEKNDPLDFSNRFNRFRNPLETATQFLDKLKHVSNGITLKIKPDGSRMHPVRSCRDISDYYPEKPNGLINCFSLKKTFLFCFLIGLYFIDPNEGSNDDAVLVYCKLTDRLTCVNSTNGLIQSNIFFKNRIYSGQRIQLMGDLLQQSEVYIKENFFIKYFLFFH